MVFSWPDYLAAFLASAVLSWSLTPLLLRFALRRRMLDYPDARKAQTSPIPYLGGVAIVGSFSLAVLVAAVAAGPSAGLDDLFLIIGLGLLLSIMGLVD